MTLETGEAIFTIGYSTHTLQRFIAMLRQHGITALCDVRSKPYSRVNPQFNREALAQSLRQQGIAYVFLGKELGARSEDPECYIHGKIQYDRLAATDLFQKGLNRVCEGMKEYRVALMCAEKEPLVCHRAILIGRYLDALGIAVLHILGDGRLESQRDTLGRLLRQLKLQDYDMFSAPENAVEDAYRIQGERIAYGEEDVSSANTELSRSISR